MEHAMSQSMAGRRVQHWAQIHESSYIAGMRLLFWLFRIVGRWPLRAALYPVVLWYMMTRRASRVASKEYLRRVVESSVELGITSDGITVFRHFASFAESILDKMLLWSGLYKTDQVKFVGRELIMAQIAAKSGGLLICCHLGNLELGRFLSKQLAGFKMTALIHTKHAQRFNRLLSQLDPESQVNVMQVTELSPATAILLAEKIAQGEFVAIAGERVPVALHPRYVLAEFFGALAPFPIGPYILASLFQCPIYLMFSVRPGPTAEIHFELFRQSIRLPRKSRDQALGRLAEEYAGRLEHFCRRAPLQWFNFYDFWRVSSMDSRDAKH
jgi:predicted LPLAT superfamily acyltransferase